MKNIKILLFLLLFSCGTVFAANSTDIVEAMGGQEVVDTLPVLSNTEDGKYTDYIFKIPLEKINAPMMKGKASARNDAPFIVFKLKEHETDTIYSCTLVEKAGNYGENYWVALGQGQSSCERLLEPKHYLTDDQLEVFAKLVKGETVENKGSSKGHSSILLPDEKDQKTQKTQKTLEFHDDNSKKSNTTSSS